MRDIANRFGLASAARGRITLTSRPIPWDATAVATVPTGKTLPLKDHHRQQPTF
jgi:hypothetical protein